MIVQTTGKQISYWMDYDNFLSLSQKALDLGCTIVKEYLDQGRVYNSLAPSTKIPQYTHLPHPSKSSRLQTILTPLFFSNAGNISQKRGTNRYPAGEGAGGGGGYAYAGS